MNPSNDIHSISVPGNIHSCAVKWSQLDKAYQAPTPGTTAMPRGVPIATEKVISLLVYPSKVVQATARKTKGICFSVSFAASLSFGVWWTMPSRTQDVFQR